MLTFRSHSYDVEVTFAHAQAGRTGAGPSSSFLASRGRTVGAERERIRFRDLREARHVLVEARRHALPAARALLARHGTVTVISRLSDAEVLEELAVRLLHGTFAAYRTPIAARQFILPTPGDVAADSPLAAETTEELAVWTQAEPHAFEGLDVGTEGESPHLEVETTQEAEVEEAELVFDAEPGPMPAPVYPDYEPIDVAAQAVALKSAAAVGAPFCEECEKARQALAAKAKAEEAPPEPELEHVDAPTQAAALTKAADAGTPFCEECEKARLVQAAKAQQAEEPPEEEAESAQVDAAAQAATLKEASVSAIPFCEECEKARQQQAAAAAAAGTADA